jgi:alkylation response protein AidB-like acyl-CoA dehydrogenase
MTETVEQFRSRARSWLASNLPRISVVRRPDRIDDAWYGNARELQRRIWDGGFAGICWPTEYGGLGLDYEYQRAFTEESAPYEVPVLLNIPTFGILAATLIDFGTGEQKARHLPAILKGEEFWVQFLSEPSGGSDLAGCLTSADRDGDTFILNGSKIWSSAAYASDYAMCLARTNWDVPKHRGLTMFILKTHQPGVHIEQIRQVNNAMEFCQEFFDRVPLHVSDVIGEIDEGWAVATRMLLHERTAVGGGSPYTSGRTIAFEAAAYDDSLLDLALRSGRGDDPRVCQIVAQSHVEEIVYQQLVERVSAGLRTGQLPGPSGSMLKLFHAMLGVHRAEASLEIAADHIAVWSDDDSSESISRELADSHLNRQAMCLGGGSNEIQKNIISERLLGMPREWAGDGDVAYRDVKRSSSNSNSNSSDRRK